MGLVCLDKLYRHFPTSTFHNLIVASNEALANTKSLLGLLEPGPVGLHLIVYNSFLCSLKSCNGSCESKLHTFAVKSSEQEARSLPAGHQVIAFTSFWWPLKHFIYFDLPTSPT